MLRYQNSNKGQWMKPILKTLLILTVYELTKYVTEQIIVYIQANE